MLIQAIALGTVKTLSISGIVAVAALAFIATLLISARIGRIVTILVAVVFVVVLWTQIREVDHHHKVCDNLNMSILGIHYTVSPYCKRS